MPNVFLRIFPMRLVYATAFALVAIAESSAQSLTFGELSGIVQDASRQPVRDAYVRAIDQASGAVRSATTGRDGRFRFGALAAGRYQVAAEALGYRPVVVTDVVVAAGHSAVVTITFRTAVPPVTQIDTVRTTGSAATGLSWLMDRGYADLLGGRRILGDAALLSTTADESGVEGLPWRLTGLMIDGSRAANFGAPGSDGAEAAGQAFPLRGITSASAGGLGFDVEAGGTGVGIRATTMRGADEAALRGGIEGGTADYGAHVVAGGALQGDTAQAVFGADYQRSEISRPLAFGSDANAAAFTGSLLAPYRESASRFEERFGGFGRLDFQPSERLAVNMRASATRTVSSGLGEASGLVSSYGTDYKGLAANAAVNIFARLSARFTQEFRISADITDANGSANLLPRTTLAGAGITVGAGEFEPFDEARTTPRVASILHARLGSHQLKAGFAYAQHRVDARYSNESEGSFRFGDGADLAAGIGAWRRLEGAVPAGEFSMSERAFFLQDAWEVARGFSLTLGARWDGTSLPGGEIEQNADWLAVSGIDNRLTESKITSFSPRLGMRWEVGGAGAWVLEGGAGIFQELPDSRDIAEALTLDRSTAVRYGTGALGTWPAAPSAAAASEVGRTMTMLGPEFQGPRTRRLALGLSRQFGHWNGFANGVYRHTDFLTRRRDLNLPSSPTGTDQYGRPLYGRVQKLGSLLAVAPATNRRFPEFDAVHVLEASGYSDFWAMTVGTERVRDRGVSVGLSYTFSRTTDNVPGLGRTATLSPFPSGLAGLDWTDGTSDRDVPHRLLAAAEWSAGRTGPMRLGVVYRLQSGVPFTPGLRTGVDANGDGSWNNDPAFVDYAIAGMGPIIAEHSCVGSRAGTFIERNACRGELQHRIDLRASFRIMQLYAGRLEFVIDALDVTAVARGRIDDALLLVDRTGTVTTTAGVTNIPYVANPNFGGIIADRSPGMLLRAGLRIVP